MRAAPLFLLLIPELALAMPWWIESEQAPALSASLETLWPGHDVEVVSGAPASGDGIWWSEGALFFRNQGQLRSDAVPADDFATQVVLARAWAGSVEVLDGGWLPPELSTSAHVERSRVRGYLRVDAASTAQFAPSVSLATGLAFQRARAGVRLSGGLDEANPLTLSTQVSAWVPVRRSALELGLGPGLAWQKDRVAPLVRSQLTVWAPDLDGNRVGVGLAADFDPRALPQLKDAFAIRAEVSWTFGPSR
ncbi:MAG: hypothetical protein EP330_29480 [Deltaproteobacteria bacterium]|nr:MAG: hypothetical protein EP330_29480 [Deltaproteobacteria bacterium]